MKIFRRKLRPSRLQDPILDAFEEGCMHFAVPVAFVIGMAIGVMVAHVR